MKKFKRGEKVRILDSGEKSYVVYSGLTNVFGEEMYECVDPLDVLAYESNEEYRTMSLPSDCIRHWTDRRVDGLPDKWVVANDDSLDFERSVCDYLFKFNGNIDYNQEGFFGMNGDSVVKMPVLSPRSINDGFRLLSLEEFKGIVNL